MADDSGRFHGLSRALGGLSRLARKGEDALADALGYERDEPSPYVIVRREDKGRGIVASTLGWASVAWGVMCLLSTVSLGFVYLVVGGIFSAAGWVATRRGRNLRRSEELAEEMSERLGQRQSISLLELGRMVGLPQGDLRSRLDYAIGRGLLPEGRVAAPLGKEKLYLTEASYEADCALRDARASGRGQDWDGSWHEQRPERPVASRQERVDDAGTVAAGQQRTGQSHVSHAARDTSTGDEQADAVIASCRDYAERLRSLSRQVTDADVGASLASIANKVGSMADYVHRHPTSASHLRRLTGYYLPTTAQLAESYAELERQGSGENASSTREGLRSTLRDVDEGISKLSDDLLQEQTFDLKADMEVMRSMLEQDGLSDDEDGPLG